MDPDTLDELDRQLVHALQLDARAPFSRIAEVLGTSDRTIARRYGRLRSAHRLRVVGLPSPKHLGLTDWFVRLRCTPDSATQIAAALARRPDTSWVSLMSGGTEITCIARTRGRSDAEGLLLHKLPRTPRLVSVTAHSLLHPMAGTAGWPGRMKALSDKQITELSWQPPPDAQAPAEPDESLLAALAEDGRAAFPDLSRATGWSESTVRRRLDQLRAEGTVYFDIDIDPLLFGCASEAILWLTVAPAELRTVGAALATHQEIAYAAATTGPSNVVAFAVCRDGEALYDYLAGKLGALPGVLSAETAPVIRRVKRAGAPVG
ncbi:Lrp/AsnC family transcriptional regulator [Amycolatopsis acidicola]|uniref:Lrp/AsnC family transcriptional regulator n=1 Tax=Amycolatopsis acidicola TaxID=2596893 RepID=UPI001FB640D7|nr:Lrp/AsnC family transcriptional regulator [Amycolatopsis acidicola]